MELSTQQLGVLEQLELLIRRGDSPTDAGRKLVTMGLDGSLVHGVLDAREAIANDHRHLAVGAALTDLEDSPAPWYTGPRDEDIFWPALREALLADSGWRAAVPGLDSTSTDVVGLLADPHSPKIATRGLVLGYVQSGKTANFTATIAKAADAGYRLFIVLSGVHNALRRQTQIRLDEQLHELNKTRWLQLTDEQRDFGNPVKALALVSAKDLRLIAVVKKNVSRLTRLRDWLMDAHAEGGLDNCPVLVIDDESDQASPNTARNAELDRAAINQRIVDLLKLPRVAYIGYTATPFANVLINPADAHDMYPRHFIYALPKPESYFGSEELFGTPLTEDEEDLRTVSHDMIRIVPDEEVALHRPSGKTPFDAQVTPSLGDAIRWFVMATAARRARVGRPQHSSMLIHTTMRVDPQLQYLPVIKDYVRGLRDQWALGDHTGWRDQWTVEQAREPSVVHGLDPVDFGVLTLGIPEVLASVKAVADNSRSTDRLIYGDEPATVIAVGGNTLSRGLTLEGLVSSFFLRTSNAYDSLMQMGRWFGYRHGYGDLPRIWTSGDLSADFRFLAEIEGELRLEIERYRSEGARPSELPVRIRVHPTMQVTARNKMQFAVPGEASYSGQRPQTTYFRHRDQAQIAKNRSAAQSLLSAATLSGAEVERQPSRIVIRDVAADLMLKFVREFTFHEDTELRSDLLEQYVTGQRRHGALGSWNVAVITRKLPAPEIDLGLERGVPLIIRSKLARSSDAETANIGTLMSKPDRAADLMDAVDATASSDKALLDDRTESGRGLILLYPIDKDSLPKPSATSRRAPLEAVDHLVGVAFSFPRAAPGSEPTDTIQVDPIRLAMGQEDDGSADYVDDEGDRDDVDLSDG